MASQLGLEPTTAATNAAISPLLFFFFQPSPSLRLYMTGSGWESPPILTDIAITSPRRLPPSLTNLAELSLEKFSPSEHLKGNKDPQSFAFPSSRVDFRCMLQALGFTSRVRKQKALN